VHKKQLMCTECAPARPLLSLCQQICTRLPCVCSSYVTAAAPSLSLNMCLKWYLALPTPKTQINLAQRSPLIKTFRLGHYTTHNMTVQCYRLTTYTTTTRYVSCLTVPTASYYLPPRSLSLSMKHYVHEEAHARNGRRRRERER
jgi:hypothetical protein